MYQCKSSAKWYDETTATALWDIKLKTKRQAYLRCMEQGMSLKAIADELGIGALLADNAYELYMLLNKNAVNIII